MEWSRLPWSPSRRQLRQFAILWLLLVAVPSGWRAEMGDNTMAFAVVATLAGALGLRWPTAIRPLWVVLLAATFPVGWLTSQVVMVVLYFAILTPLGLVLRLRGHDSLQLRAPKKDQTTYWNERSNNTPPAQYLKTYHLFL